MPDTIYVSGPEGMVTETNLRQYSMNLEVAFQQNTPELQPLFPSETIKGDHKNFDRIGRAQPLVENNTRYGDNPHSDFDYGRRRLEYGNWHQGHMVDPKDLDRVVSDPTSTKMMNLVAQVNQKRDLIVIDNIFGPAKAGDAGERTIDFVGTTAGKITVGNESSEGVVTDTIYTVAAGAYEGIDVSVSYNGTGSAGADTRAVRGITLQKLRAVRLTMLKLRSISKDDPIHIALGPEQFDQLLDIDEIKNSDYALIKRSEMHLISRWSNFIFHYSDQLLGSGTNGDPRQCIAWVPRAAKYADQGVRATMWNLPHKLNIPYMYVALSAGFTRMWGECTARINCVN